MSFAYQQIPVDDSQAVRLERGSSSGSSKRPSSAVLAVAVLGIVLLSTLVGVSFRGNRAASSSIDSSSVATEEANVRPIFRSSKEVCRDPNYSHTTLKIAHEMPVVALLGRAEGAAFEVGLFVCVLRTCLARPFLPICSARLSSLGLLRQARWGLLLCRF